MGNVFDRADRLRRGTEEKSPDASDNGAGADGTRRIVRRRGGDPAPAPAAPAAPAAEPARTVVRRPARAPEPEPVAAKEAAPTPAADLDALLTPKTGRKHKVLDEAQVAADGAPPPPPAPVVAEPVAAPAGEAAADEGLPPSIDDLLATPRRAKKVHKVLDDAQVAADGAPAPQPVVAEVAPAVVAPAAIVVPHVETSTPSLEDLLRDQGIVQHKPKKGRRIIEDDVTLQVAQGNTSVGITTGAAPVVDEERPRNKPIRFIDPATLQRDRPGVGGPAPTGPSDAGGRGKRRTVMPGRDLAQTPADRRRRGKGRGAPAKPARPQQLTTPAAHKRVVKIHGQITAGDLADALGIKAPALIKYLIGMGQMATMNDYLDLETAQLVAGEYGYEVEDVSFKEEALLDAATLDAAEDLTTRAPVVTIMGHVDHGKTTLLDAIRSARVAEGEAGGITQHISAFDVTAGKNRICFVDTPGHAAFTAMRARGAQITDIVVLVVAATEGVMPQTVEVISHAKAAGVPIVVALNKTDLPEANVDRCKQQLSDHGLQPEDWGGETQVVPVSAKARKGIDDLLEAINVQAEVLELTANSDRKAVGRVIEAQFEKGRGPVAIVLVQRGTLRDGDIVVAGTEQGRVRAMYETGSKKPKKLKEAGPSTPVALLGLSGLPEAGDEFAVVESEKVAKTVVMHREEERRRQRDTKRAGVSLDDIYRRLQEGEAKELNLILKADVQGSIEALKKVLTEIEVRDTRVKIIHSGVGGITEGDVTLAEASSAVIVGFGVRPDAIARRMAESSQVDIRTYRVIYEAVDEIKQALVGMLEPEYKERVQGHAEVRQVFRIGKVGAVAGCMVLDGKVGRNNQVRLLRDSVVVWEGKLKSVRRFKDDVKEVLTGFECGIGLDGFDDVKEGDVIEAFIIEEIRPEV